MELSNETLIGLMRTMLLIRRFEEKIIDAYPDQDMKSPVHLYIGEEAVASGVCAHLRQEDYVFTTHRSHGHCLAKGVGIKELYAEFYGRVTGCSRGKGGSMHPCSPEHNVLGTSAIVGGCIPLATGTALASKMRRDGRVSVTFFGDGASEEGAFHESMNFAALRKLPVIFVCENNYYATNSPLSARQPHADMVKKAMAYDMPGISVDGNDVIAVYQAADEAVKRARADEGPTLIEAKTYRWKGHVGPDCDHDKGCRLKSELDDWMTRCPIKSYEKYLTGRGVMSADEIVKMIAEFDLLMDDAIKSAKADPLPGLDELYTNVYYEGDK